VCGDGSVVESCVVTGLERNKRVASQFAVKHETETNCWTHRQPEQLNKQNYRMDKYWIFFAVGKQHCLVYTPVYCKASNSSLAKFARLLLWRQQEVSRIFYPVI
jgi:hypothetical protein